MKHYLDDLYAVKDIINDNQVILSATDTIWSLICDAMNPEAYACLLEIRNPVPEDEREMIVSSISQLKYYIREIHPRIETLLLYHERPLSVFYRPASVFPRHLISSSGLLAFRLTKDPFLIDLIELIGRPLLSVPASSKNFMYPSNYEDIDNTIVNKCKYVIQSGKHRGHMKPSVLVSFDPEGELIFHRK